MGRRSLPPCISESKGQHLPFQPVLTAPNLMVIHPSVNGSIWGTFPFPSRSWCGWMPCFSELLSYSCGHSAMRWALAPNHTPFFSCWWALVTLPHQQPPCFRSPEVRKTYWWIFRCLPKVSPHSKNITHKNVQDPGNQSAFYFTVHSCKFLHFQGNQITFRLALLVTKSYNYPGFKNKIGWYTWTILSL